MRRFQNDDRLERIAALLVSCLMLAASCSSDPVGATSDGGGGSGGSGGAGGSGIGDASDAFSCDAKSKCPNDATRNVAQCEQMRTHPTCGPIFLKFMKCIGDHQVCKDDGTTDIPVWMAACVAEQAENAQCFGMPDSGR